MTTEFVTGSEATVQDSATDVPVRSRILLVDDEQSVLLSMQAVLELDGYEVLVASSGQQALDVLARYSIDLLLTDLRLDDSDGLELLRALRHYSSDAVAIMLTGYASLETAVEALRQGAYDYLVKPCDIVELRTTVARGLERRQLGVQLRERVHDLEVANETIRSLNLELEGRVERATAELREQVKLRDEFMATVSHDLKSPLSFIKGLSSLRRRRAVVSPETQPLLDALEQIEHSAGRMARQLDELVDASCLEAGRAIDLHREPTDLVALARQVVAEHQQTTERHAVQIESSRPELMGSWDPVRIERVLTNLLNNAIKYSPRGGSVSVRIDVDSQAVVQVEDQGEGIPAADLPHIFERFRRGANVEKHIPGTGIGLAGARQIVELHGGTIGAESRVGEGTTVTLRLPLG
jgi:signal transduction histidine kinase